MNAHRLHLGPELKQETYFVEGKGWRTHHVISQTSSFEREATDEEIDAQIAQTPEPNLPETVPEQESDESVPEKKRGRPKKAE